MRWLITGWVLLLVYMASALNVTLQWDPSTDAVLGYKLYTIVPSLNSTSYMDVGNKLSATVSNLSPGARYTFAATAYTLGNESVFSDPVYYTASSAAVNVNTTSPILSIHISNAVITVTDNILIPEQWTLQYSTNLLSTNWMQYATGSNCLVNVVVTNIGKYAFFRLAL